MSRVAVLRSADRLAVPWRNGGGTTCQVAASPVAAGVDAFDWRVSTAEVAAAGPFSRFEGVDRTIVILAGTLDLTVGGQRHRLSGEDAPFAFPGDIASEGAPVGAAVSDLNVMVARSKAVARVVRSRGGTIAGNDGAMTILFATQRCGVRHGGVAVILEPGDAVLVRDDGAEAVAYAGGAVVIRIAAA